MTPVRFLITLLLATVLAACSSVPDHPLYDRSGERFTGTGFTSFEAYQTATTTWIRKHRYYVTDDHEREIRQNAPFELRPDGDLQPDKAIILVHGLGDSPFSFSDLARQFANDGYLVRTLLLSGHGTRPGDMLKVRIRDWEEMIREQVAILKTEVSSVSLGGFSTGANLVTSYAVQDTDIKALYLFSPAFKSDRGDDFLAPLASTFRKWAFAPDARAHNNGARYRTVPMKGFGEFYKSSARVRDHLKKTGFDRPAFLALSQHDSVVDVDRVRELFEEHFTDPASRLIWYGDRQDTDDPRILFEDSFVPEFKVSNYSHMALMFSPDNAWYGVAGDYRFCSNGQQHLENHIRRCRRGENLWYSAYGTRDAVKYHARLTFNPKFEHMMQVIRTITEAAN